MERQPKNNVVSLRDEALKKLEGQSNLPSSEKLHLLSVLKNHPEVFLHGKEVGNEGMEGMVDVLIDGDTEVLYYALLLQDPRVHKWDGQGEEPPRPWINTSHPKVQAAQQRMDTHSLGPEKSHEAYVDVAQRLWARADTDQKRNIVAEVLKNPRIQQWYEASGEPCPEAGYIQMDSPEILELLSPEWQVYVRDQVRAFRGVDKERGIS